MTVPVPSAMAFRAMNCACMSVGNAGYGAVRIDRLRPLALHVQLDPVTAGIDMRASLHQLVQHSLEQRRVGILQTYTPASRRSGDQIGSVSIRSGITL